MRIMVLVEQKVIWYFKIIILLNMLYVWNIYHIALGWNQFQNCI